MKPDRCPKCGAANPTVLRFRASKTGGVATCKCAQCGHVFSDKQTKDKGANHG